MKSQNGFTLIEAIVATSLFAFVISSVIGVYIATTQLDRKARSSRAVSQNARFILEHLAKEIRNGMIYYPGYPGGIANTTLSLQNQANEVEYYYISGTNLILEKNGATTNLNSAAVKVTKLNFLIAPAGNPYTTARTYNEQPRVTIILELTSNYGSATTDVVKLNLQDTFTTRSYPSRQ